MARAAILVAVMAHAAAFSPSPPPRCRRGEPTTRTLTRHGAGSTCPPVPIPERSDEQGLAVLGLGCFWGPEKEFRDTKGVVDALVGYCGGSEPSPTYKDIKDYTEAVMVTYQKDVYGLDDIVGMALERHPPMPPAMSGNQYRSVVWVRDEEERAAAERAIAKQAASFVTVEDLGETTFYRAEEYHQNYMNKNGRR
uniref:peptide-methionine (S)-S-oxide reductase n=1 Tax=Phaeomonas parva TaxID=124430 RepID=A0A7S1TVN4_9STRA|mmetsp:Transcript_19891/g.60251  ORF Transcript_19891/g.60251 Transcript_19891/m.60251 type:complete len:195 (+) Transcript_19891:93-677(+)